MYAGDSFYTLSPSGQWGLALLSLVLSIAALALCGAIARRKAWYNRLLIGLGVLFVFQWLSPQIYYGYYQLILEGLPWQIVIGKPPDLRDFYDILFFRGPRTLSAHAQGVLGWLLLAQAVGGFGVSRR